MSSPANTLILNETTQEKNMDKGMDQITGIPSKESRATAEINALKGGPGELWDTKDLPVIGFSHDIPDDLGVCGDNATCDIKVVYDE